MGIWQDWAPYVPMAKKRQLAEQFLKEAGQHEQLSPVRLAGQVIASSFWGRAWCNNLEAYSDLASRLPRGRSYLRAGAVVDLRITAGGITARVQGSSLYTVRIRIEPLDAARWQELVRCCTAAGPATGLGSIVELLQGRMERQVIAALTEPRRGLFPAPHEIQLSCSCPDWATLCKHAAATLYGVGARLDSSPELLFVLRQVAMEDLVLRTAASLAAPAVAPDETLAGDAGELGALFGIDLGSTAEPVPPAVPRIETDSDADPAVPPAPEPSAAAAPTPRPGRAGRRAAMRTPPRETDTQVPAAELRKLRALRALLRRLEGPRPGAPRSRGG